MIGQRKPARAILHSPPVFGEPHPPLPTLADELISAHGPRPKGAFPRICGVARLSWRTSGSHVNMHQLRHIEHCEPRHVEHRGHKDSISSLGVPALCATCRFLVNVRNESARPGWRRSRNIQRREYRHTEPQNPDRHAHRPNQGLWRASARIDRRKPYAARRPESLFCPIQTVLLSGQRYASDALLPMPPTSGGTGISPLLSATNALYLIHQH